MHDSAKRLLDFARQATAASRRPVLDFNELTKRLDVSPAVMTNWKKRGVSKDGALSAERVFGCSPEWILHGGDLRPVPPTGAHVAAEKTATYSASPRPSSLQDVILALGDELQRLDDLSRAAIGPLLARLVDQPDQAETIASMAAALVAVPRKRASAG